MAQILVDFENVICCGVTLQCFTGVNYLNENDTLYLFYSDSCMKLRGDYLENIKRSGCKFKLCKLLHTGKNALDFYIVTEIGRLIEQGEKSIAVISNDNGYKAVIDYVAQNEEIADDVTIVLSCSIESTFGKFKDAVDKERWNRICKEKELVDLDAFRLEQKTKAEKCVTSMGDALKGILETKHTVEETKVKTPTVEEHTEEETTVEETTVEEMPGKTSIGDALKGIIVETKPTVEESNIEDIIVDSDSHILEYKIKKAVSDTHLNMYQKEIFKFAKDNIFISPNDLYKKSIHIFGRKNGTEISRILRVLLF